MKSLEAFDDLKKRNEALKKEGHFHIGTQVMDIFEKLARRDTKEGIIVEEDYEEPEQPNDYYCPCCSNQPHFEDKFCSECGQRLEWKL